jgi:hypothetical protein
MPYYAPFQLAVVYFPCILVFSVDHASVNVGLRASVVH